MCGITGCFDFAVDSKKQLSLVGKMVNAMRHRGPDSSGVIAVSKSPLVTLGHSRLSIIDRTPESCQPMTDNASGNTIVFNGEIYNFKILKNELERFGHRFHTKSDTEVILKSYNQWGPDCCKKLRGIFAFAIWDKKKQKLFMARDHMGVKPFYYYHIDKKFIFASEVRSLIASEEIPRKIDYVGLESYLAYGSLQEPFTLIKGVRSLRPGNCAYYDIPDGLVQTRYWAPPAEQRCISEPDAAELVHAKLKETAKLQLIADVPLGIFLSGGIDSSAIVSLVRQVHGASIKTFSIIFEDSRYDERKYARMVAKKNNTDHVELELSSAIIMDNLKKSIDSYDQPSLDGLNTWFVSKLVKEAGLTVALSGVGGDELFIGYGGFRKTLLIQKAQPFFSHLPVSLGNYMQTYSSSEKFRKLGELAGFSYQGYFISRKLFSLLHRKTLLKNEIDCKDCWFDECFNEIIADAKRLPDELTRISWYESRTYMLSTLLRDTDQMSMAHSLEVRVPLIDPEVVDLLLSIPGSYKKNKYIPKNLLVKAAGEGLPRECIERRKMGFAFPFDQYIKECLGKEILTAFNHYALPFFEKGVLLKIYEDYQKGFISWSRVWALFVLHRWIKQNSIEE